MKGVAVRYVVVIAISSVVFAISAVVVNKRMEIIFLMFWVAMTFAHGEAAWRAEARRASPVRFMLGLAALYGGAGCLGCWFVSEGSAALAGLAEGFGLI